MATPAIVTAIVQNITPTVTQAASVVVANATPTVAPTPVMVNIVNAVQTTVTTAPAMNPVLDIAPFHGITLFWLNTIPLWAILGFIVGAYWIWYNIGWWNKCGALAPCFGYKDALMAAGSSVQQTIVFTKSKKWFIRMLTYHSEGILYFKDLFRTDMWHMGSSSAVGKLGGLSAAITKDSVDEVVDPIADIALCKACDDFIHGRFGDQQNVKRASEETKMLVFNRSDGSECDFITAARERLIPDTIRDFDDYIKLRPILERIWPDGVKIPCYCFYDPYDSDKFTPKNRSPALFGGLLLRKARDFASDNIPDLSFWDRNGVAMILVLGGLIILGAAYLASR